MNQRIESIGDYISTIRELIEQFKEEGVVVYRGESRNYEITSCRPNIFRDNRLQESKNFEVNILDSMRAKGLIKADNYFEAAVEAQHGGFPSRLLDVTYNALVALFFAVTPHYTKKIDNSDQEDGLVYIFKIPELFSPASSDIQRLYEDLITDTSPLRTSEIFEGNHKLLDHVSKNKRIIAQQGAFILFYGNKFKSFPERYIKRLVIDCKSKKRIREELKEIFGIHMGAMYPETENYVEDIIEKSSSMNRLTFSFENEFISALTNMQLHIKYEVEEIQCSNDYDIEVYDLVVRIDSLIEEIILFKENAEEFLVNGINILDKIAIHVLYKNTKLPLREYNKFLNSVYEFLNSFKGITICPLEDIEIDMGVLNESK